MKHNFKNVAVEYGSIIIYNIVHLWMDKGKPKDISLQKKDSFS